MPSSLLSSALALFDYTQTLRRDFHMHPELGFQEVRTAGIIANELRSLGLEVSTGIAETGVVALIEGQHPGPVILLRFDIDALPIQEATEAPYASQTAGKMHACGHDGHTAIGLTVARLLHERREQLHGTIKLVFQPAEEGVVGPKGMGGAEQMVAEGVMENPKVDYTLALHLWNEKPLGWVGVGSGPIMAGAEFFRIQVRGVGGHGAAPHASADPIVAAAQIITSLQTIVSRNVSPQKAAVITVGSLQAGQAFNVIPAEATLTGTIRTFDPEVRALVLRRCEEVVSHTAQALGCQATFEARRITPAVSNDPAVTAVVQKTVQKILPEATLDTANYLTMGSEDMAFMMEKAPGCYFLVGSANPGKGLAYGHHHPKFDFDEDALPRAAALMAQAALDLATEHASEA